jgi:hypothetical protein
VGGDFFKINKRNKMNDEREFDYSELEYCENCGRPPKECSGCGEENE